MEKASKLKIILSLLKKNGLLFIWIVGGLLIIYAKNKEITLSSIVLSVFVSIIFYGIFIWGYKNKK
ncbi:hypothetical protein D3C80_1772330 [compost metagenome]